MLRNLSIVAVVAVVSFGGQEVYGQRYLVFNGVNILADLDYYIGLQVVGNPTITTLLGPASVGPSEDYFDLITQFMPEIRYTERG